ncbi:MAG TPA: three-Cys-motif partner protein TcmP [Blastocatellia bacterium]|nr:three-Cys-motif partner protein TcmP [Blastocatellia bacterium]
MNKENLSQNDLYIGREQTWVKHQILRKYLQRFAYIIGSNWDAITYVDCFSGPWKVESDDFRDSSFSIALEELRKARADLASRNLKPKLRCLFLEKKKSSYQKLKQYAESVKGEDEVVTLHAAVEDSIDEIVKFTKKGGFPFIFIDPTGWTGFGMDAITPLLKISPGDVLINFMMGDIRRFLEFSDEATQESLVRLFGSASFRNKVQGLTGQDREDAAVSAYAEELAKRGHFGYTPSAIVLRGEADRTRFHLIYATRHPKGLEVFKEAEKKAMEEMQPLRAEAHKRKSPSSQGELFEPEVLHGSLYYDQLRERHLAKAKEKVIRLLQAKGKVFYDEVWAAALQEPLVWESDLKQWLGDWGKKGLLSIEGLKSTRHALKHGQGHSIIWRTM